METPPFAPRHDLMVRIEGPAVADLMDNFADRWAQSVEARRESWLGRAIDWLRRRLGNDDYPSVDPAPALPPARGDHWVQVVRTTPGGEDGILGAYVRAIRNARRYVYIENQYFRSPVIGRGASGYHRGQPSAAPGRGRPAGQWGQEELHRSQRLLDRAHARADSRGPPRTSS